MTEVARPDGRTRDTRARIRSAAVDLFSSQGFAATSVREITAACSVTPGALYNHYRSKEHILADIFHETRRQLDALTERALLAGGDRAARRLALVAAALTWYHAEHRAEASVVLSQHPWMAADEQKDLLDWHRSTRRSIEALLHEGLEAGEVQVPSTPDVSREVAVAVVAKGLLGMWTGVGAWFRAGGEVTSVDVAQLYARLALQSVNAPPEDDVLDAFRYA